MTILKEFNFCVAPLQKDTIVSSMNDILEYPAMKSASRNLLFERFAKICPKNAGYVKNKVTRDILENDGYKTVPVVDIVAEYVAPNMNFIVCHIFGDLDFEINLPEIDRV